jgi:hypothetical protein
MHLHVTQGWLAVALGRFFYLCNTLQARHMCTELKECVILWGR